MELSVQSDPGALGFGLAALNYDPKRFEQFPTVTATLELSGQGYFGFFGWLQIVTRAVAESGERLISVDVPPIWDGRDWPLAAFGYLPTFFDAPANPDRADEKWIAQTFLVGIPDIARSARIEAYAGFTWGYELNEGRPTAIGLTTLTEAAWNQARRFLIEEFPSWEFGDWTDGTSESVSDGA